MKSTFKFMKSIPIYTLFLVSLALPILLWAGNEKPSPSNQPLEKPTPHPVNWGDLIARPFPTSLANMEEIGYIVADGEVTEVTVIKIERDPVPPYEPFIHTTYRARFKVENLIKSNITIDNTSDLVINLEYTIRDRRYTGQPRPKLKVGDKFRLYLPEWNTYIEGNDITAYIFSTSQTRPDGYKLEEKENAEELKHIVKFSDIETASRSSETTPQPIASPSETIKSPSSFPWLVLVLLLLIAACTGAYWLLKKRQRDNT